MPEGHTIHRLARDVADRFAGHPLDVSSPQGKFADGAALLDGAVLRATEAHGKHLFLGFLGSHDFPGSSHGSGRLGWVHVHLGLYGTFRFGEGPPPAPVGQVRLRLATRPCRQSEGTLRYADLRGPTRCELLTEPEKQAVDDRLGPDPLRPASDPEAAWARISRSRTSIAALLMDQKIVSGVGNVYRAEVLFRHGIDPYRAGRDLTRAEWDAIWSDLVTLMTDGVRKNRIDTVRDEHTPEAMGRAPRVDDHGGEVYVYRRAAQPCLVCSTPVATAELAARNLFWCPTCQQE